jgi:hypothetical protein
MGKWKQGLRSATSRERLRLLHAEAKARRIYLEERVSDLCAASDLGIADCSELRVSCKLGIWRRDSGHLYCTIECVSAPEKRSKQFRWCIRDVRS